MLFDKTKLRDIGFRSQFNAKLAQIQTIKEANNYLTFVANRQLTDELAQIYAENLKAYEKSYQPNLMAYQELKHYLETNAKRWHKSHYRQAEISCKEIKTILDKEDYHQNALAAQLIENLRNELKTWENAKQNWLNQAKTFEENYLSLKNEVWLEQIGLWEKQHKDFLAKVEGEVLPVEGLCLLNSEIEPHKTAKKSRIDELKTKVNQDIAYTKRIEHYENSAVRLADFEKFERELLAEKNRKMKRNLMIGAGIGLIIILGFFFAGLYGNWQQEEKNVARGNF